MEATAVAGQPGSEPFDLPHDHAELRAEAAALASEFADRHHEVRRHPIDHGELHPELWRELCERGWTGLPIAEEHGGAGAGLLAYVAVMQALAEHNLILWMPALTTSVAHAIAEVGPDPVRRRWLEPVASGRAIIALAVTEPECGHNVFRSKTAVRRDGDRFVVDGHKAVTSGVDLADAMLVFGRAPERAEGGGARFTTVLVEPDAAGIERTELPMGGREGVRQFRLDFEGVEVLADSLVGEEGQGLLTLWPAVQVERIMTSALCVGGARACISRALSRATERTIFGERPIGAEQSIQHPLASLHARAEAAELLLHRAAARFDAGVDGFAIAGEANMAKVLAADLLFDAADHAMRTLGAEAWDEREGMIDAFLDARLARSAPVSQELALNFIAQHVLGLPAHR